MDWIVLAQPGGGLVPGIDVKVSAGIGENRIRKDGTAVLRDRR
jgi:hypothetical protein